MHTTHHAHRTPCTTHTRTMIDPARALKAPASTKYPSTPHLPFSPGVNPDDVVGSAHAAVGAGVGDDVVITEKLDGGNCCVKAGGAVFARTHSKVATHKSFDTVKAMFAGLKHMMPEGVDLYGENMTAVHSINYSGLRSYFYLFAARRGDTWLGWEEICAIAATLGIPTVPLVFRGKVESVQHLESMINGWAAQPSALDGAGSDSGGSAHGGGAGAGGAGAAGEGAIHLPEGFVCRKAEPFEHAAFGDSLAKYVRANHNQLDAGGKHNWTKATLN